MRRVSVLALVVLMSLLAIAAAGRSSPTRAQDASPPAMMAHPLVGSWSLDTDTSDPSNPPDLGVFAADGSYIEMTLDGAAAGHWESTGADTADVNIWFLQSDNGQYLGTLHVRAAVTVAADGASFDADYTLELMQPDGTMSGQYGPAHAHGTRLTAEPMGSPTGSISDFFAKFGGTPVASPAP
jgi:hypothetical protein